MTDDSDHIAVIGSAARFPGASQASAFWDKIYAGEDCLTRFDATEAALHPSSRDFRRDPNFVPVSGDLADADSFDHEFFNYSMREARITDPQHRLFLELCWHALEESGLIRLRKELRCGVFASTSMSSYALALKDANALPDASDPVELIVASDKDYIASRVAYALGLDGPAVAVQSACSSSLVAVHLACQSLQAGECDIALVGGATVIMPQKTGYLYLPGSIRAKDGVCRPFDICGGGTVFSSGGGVVVLRRLDDAQDNNDPTQAVILGSAINNDGDVKVGYAAPSLRGQSNVISEAMTIAEVTPDQIGMIEAHGTGTDLGDPIEVAALTRAYQSLGGWRTNHSVALGSVKANIGHTDAAAGIAGFIKVSQSLAAQCIPPATNLTQVNPKLNIGNSPFTFLKEPQRWPDAAPYAGVSSFGIGGTNCHVVLGPAPKLARKDDTTGQSVPIRVSAKTATALAQVCDNLSDRLEQHCMSDNDLGLWADTFAATRELYPARMLVDTVGKSVQHVVQELRQRANAVRKNLDIYIPPKTGAPRPIAFVFPGQGMQKPGMSRALAAADTVFADHLHTICDEIHAFAKIDLSILLLWSSDDVLSKDEASEKLRPTRIAQLALFAHSLAAARTAMEKGLKPTLMLGHSIGCVIAAVVAGVFSAKVAIKIVDARGRAMEACEPGSMAAVFASLADIQPLLPSSVCCAAVNGPATTVISGRSDDIRHVMETLKNGGFEGDILQTSHAFHSPMMQEAREQFFLFLKGLDDFAVPKIPIISDQTGKELSELDAINPRYWADHLTNTVKFGDAIQTAQEMHSDIVFLHFNDRSMSSLIRFTDPNAAVVSPFIGTLETAQSFDSLAWALDYKQLDDESGLTQVQRDLPLPLYPFARTRHTLLPDTATPAETSENRPQHHPITSTKAPRPESLPAPIDPENVYEHLLTDIWSKAFQIDPIGVDDNFYDLGGSSILALHIAAQARSAGIPLQPKDILKCETVRATIRAVIDVPSDDNQATIDTVSSLPFSGLGLPADEHLMWPSETAVAVSTAQRLQPDRLARAANRVIGNTPMLSARADFKNHSWHFKTKAFSLTGSFCTTCFCGTADVEEATKDRLSTLQFHEAIHILHMAGDERDLIAVVAHPCLGDVQFAPNLIAELIRCYENPDAPLLPIGKPMPHSGQLASEQQLAPAAATVLIDLEPSLIGRISTEFANLCGLDFPSACAVLISKALDSDQLTPITIKQFDYPEDDIWRHYRRSKLQRSMPTTNEIGDLIAALKQPPVETAAQVGGGLHLTMYENPFQRANLPQASPIWPFLPDAIRAPLLSAEVSYDITLWRGDAGCTLRCAFADLSHSITPANFLTRIEETLEMASRYLPNFNSEGSMDNDEIDDILSDFAD